MLPSVAAAQLGQPGQSCLDFQARCLVVVAELLQGHVMPILYWVHWQGAVTYMQH